MSKPATIIAAVRPRHAIIQAIAGHGSEPTIDDLLTITGLARKTLSDNINAAINDVKGALLERIKCTVTSLPAYRLTVRGKTWWEANKPEEKGIVDRIVDTVAKADPETVSPEIRRAAAHVATHRKLTVARDQEFSLLNVIADIRAAIGDNEGRIMLSELAQAVEAKLETLENEQVKSNNEFEEIGYIIGEYMPDPNGSKLIDSILTMETLIDAQQAYIHSQQLIIDKLFLVKKNIEATLSPALPPLDGLHIGAETMAMDTMAILANTQALAGKLQTLLDSSRHECEGLRAQLQADSATTTLEQAAPAGYLLRVPTREHRVINKRASAEQAAVSAVNAGAPSAEVLALYPIGRASRRAQWRAA